MPLPYFLIYVDKLILLSIPGIMMLAVDSLNYSYPSENNLDFLLLFNGYLWWEYL